MNKSRVWHKSKKKCHLCGKGVDLSIATIDHLIPVSSGGSNRIENLAIAHARCNRKRGNGGLYI